ncbi:MAG TPA: response regulator transcription factor [Bacteroidales bacterium]|nr:response regulator transcription factor [Bacteroidales bacterium]
MNIAKKPVNILIADRQFLITESLKSVILKESPFYIVNVVSEKSEILAALSCITTSLLIIDPSLINSGRLSDLKTMKDNYPSLKVLVIMNSISKSELYELNNIGITSIILKTANREEIVEAVNATINGKKYYSNELLEVLFSGKKMQVKESVHLTNSEFEIVRLISEGLTTKDIAEKKFISFHTVISHRKNIFRKLGVSSVSELIMYAVKAGWINPIEYYI